MHSHETAAQWVRWGIGSMLTLSVPLLLYTLSAISETNVRQDRALAQMQREHHASEMREQQVHAEMMRALEGLVNRLEGVDERGSRALHLHEREEHRR